VNKGRTRRLTDADAPEKPYEDGRPRMADHVPREDPGGAIGAGREASAAGILSLQRTAGNSSVVRMLAARSSRGDRALLQRAPFEFDGKSLDVDDMDGFVSYVKNHADEDKIRRLLAGLAGDELALPADQRQRLTIAALDARHPINEQLPDRYAAILSALEAMKVSVPKYGSMRETIVAAGLIDRNAERIALCPTKARDEILKITRQQPSSGFVNESATAIRSRCVVLTVLWSSLNDAEDKLAFFNTGFGNDPCIAARLNGITEYAAKAAGISEAALSDAKGDPKLEGLLLEAMYRFDDEFDSDTWKRSDFEAYLQRESPGAMLHPAYHVSYDRANTAHF